jgi:hypothetical protein
MSRPVPHRVSDRWRIDRWIRLIPDGYYRPCAVERWRNGHIYEVLGVRAYKWWLPTGGDRARLTTGKHAIRSYSRSSSDCRQQLEDLEGSTHRFEAWHLLGAVVMAGLTAPNLWGGDFLSSSLLIAVNLAVNIYPIMTQRYNRVRIEAVLRRMGSSGET